MHVSFAPAARLALALALALAPLATSLAHAAPTAAVLLTAYDGTGSVASIDLTTHGATSCTGALCNDLAGRYAFGHLFILGRSGCDNIQVLDPLANYATLLQFSVGNGSNPQDIAVVNPHRAYVSRYGSSDLWIVDPVTGAHTGTISLAAFADADGIPEMGQMLLAGGRLFVALQRLDQNNYFTPTDYSALAVIDTATNTVIDCDAATVGVQPLRLTGTNPVTDIVRAEGGVLLLGEVGNYGVLDGGIDVIDPPTLRALGFRSTEATLGGDILDLDILSNVQAYAIISDASYVTSAREFNPATGTLTRTLATGTGFDFSTATLGGQGELLLADRSLGATAGVRLFSTATGAETVSERRTFCLPPSGIVLLQEPVTAIAAPSAGRGLAHLTLAGVSPSRGPVRAALTCDADAHVRVSVVRADGVLVRELASGVFAPGTRSLVWDGRDSRGADVPAGAYRLVVDAGGAIESTRIIYLGR